MNRNLFIIATSFKDTTGGLTWTSKVAEYAKQHYENTTAIDLASNNALLRKNRFAEILYYFGFFLLRSNFFVFIDHRLHLRFGIPLLTSFVLKKNAYGTICHHLFYKTKTNHPRKAIEFFSEKVFLQNARFVIVPSEKTSADVQRLNVAKKKIFVVNPTCACKSDKMPQRAAQNKILAVGNLEPRKGIDAVIKALGLLKDTEFSLDIVGGFRNHDDYFTYLQDLVVEYGLSDKVKFRGRVAGDQIANFYVDASIFVFPSRHEGYGMVLLEAMSFGLPIVATDIPTTREIIKDSVNGYLCLVDDVACLSQKIRKLLTDRTLQLQLGRKNFEASKKFRGWDDVVEQTFAPLRPYLLKH